MKGSYKLTVQEEIFNKLPGIKIFVAVLKGLEASKINREGSKALLSEEWSNCRKLMQSFPNIQSHPHCASWRKAYASLGIPSKKYTTSIENLCKRAIKPDSEPRFINPLVDFYNACSLKFIVPFGGFDMSDPAIKEMDFRFTVTGDSFEALDAQGPEEIPAGEAAYVSDHKVLTRHINWKQSKEGLISDATTDVVFMAEILGDVSDDVIQEMTNFFRTQSKALLDQIPEIHLLTRANASIKY